ncbi:MAG: DEAD/DEAH box helicase, partial [Actinobacteria bacterium]|nr:DEAD/DEAH box helicase [Actinomycetota bacterium]
ALILSRELARLDANVQKILAGPVWDLVLMDEAHAARRARPVEGEFNAANLLLGLLRKLQLTGKARGMLLLSATPMQTQPWEPWDLLSVLGEGGDWLAEFGRVRDYYEAISDVASGGCDQETASRTATLISGDPHFPFPDGDAGWRSSAAEIARRLRFCKSSERASVAGWLRRGSPLSRRMYRNTRDTLRRYHKLGLLESAPPTRRVDDVRYDFTDERERHVYQGIETYITRRFEELEQEKPGKGFVMTIYRRRASSSPKALYESLSRRRRGLVRVAAQQAFEWEIEEEDAPDTRDLPDAGVGEDVLKLSAAYPTSPAVAKAELEEVNHLLRELADLGPKDSKLEQFYDQLRRVTEDGRPVLIFTEYADTMVYLRQNLVPHFGEALGCYSGEGGEKWDGKEWKPVTKDAITRDLKEGRLLILVCTDAASEGLNLQSAGAVINYDLPWNPSKVEQRIGRIDRIGQKLPVIRIVNFFLEESVDELVYKALRLRCGLFEHFVGPMQPVLAMARKMLLGQAPVDAGALEKAASEVGGDTLASETYLQSEAAVAGGGKAGLSVADIEGALGLLTGEFGPAAKRDKKRDRWTITVPGTKKAVYSGTLQELERDPHVLPLSPLDLRFREMAQALTRAGERLPLVVESCARGAFRRSVALWVDGAEHQQVESMPQLAALLNDWDGSFADPAALATAREWARKQAEAEVAAMEATAANWEREGLAQQLAAARERLKLELGRYLASLRHDDDLGEVMRQVMQRGGAAGQRMSQCLEKLGGDHEWSPELQARMAAFAAQLTPGQIKARQSFTELDAALQDPRWGAIMAF